MKRDNDNLSNQYNNLIEEHNQAIFINEQQECRLNNCNTEKIDKENELCCLKEKYTIDMNNCQNEIEKLKNKIISDEIEYQNLLRDYNNVKNDKDDYIQKFNNKCDIEQRLKK